MSAPEPIEKPENPGCGHREPVDKDGHTLDHPMPEPEKEQSPGCGQKPDVEERTDSAHRPNPEIEKQDQQSPGCGGKVQEQTTTYHSKQLGDLSDVDVEFNEKNKKHIFDDRDGHVSDTPENRARIIKLVKDPKKYLGPDENDNDWYGDILEDGTQWWAQVRNRIIRNGGLNKTAHEYNPTSGLSNFDPSKRKINN